jgi:hypothetical protein
MEDTNSREERGEKSSVIGMLVNPPLRCVSQLPGRRRAEKRRVAVRADRGGGPG